MQQPAPTTSEPLTFLCLASYEKGYAFLEQAKRQGCRVFLLASFSLQHTAKWPEGLDEIFYMPDKEHEWNLRDMLLAVSHLCRTRQIDRIVPLDDFDLEKASYLREHLRLPGLGETATRYFRDKLAMRMRAAEQGIPVPEFTPIFNYERITRYVDTVPPPWLLKPRLMAGAIGIKKFHHRQEVWDRIHSIGDEQSFFVLERFVPGDIFHVDSIWFRGEMVYAVASAYGTPPLDVTHSGGIFTTKILERGSKDGDALKELNRRVLSAFCLTDGVSHTEFIRAHEDGTFYFLETSARVGGAHISDLIQAATGINMWAEWAKVELAAASNSSYTPPEPDDAYAGLLVSLARQEWPDTSSFHEPELVWRMSKRHHVGFIVKSPDYKRVGELLNAYSERVRREYHASAPARERVRE
ncbi:MAG: ATPase [Acidobacteriaceae bacterium]|nr:ATPase [Acidobacteriaceae bacterium]MBV9778867.1 ATPase [Acidobacteriaceae bacterium]